MQKGDGTLFSPARAGVFIEAHHSFLNSFRILAVSVAQCSKNLSYFDIRYQSVMLLKSSPHLKAQYSPNPHKEFVTPIGETIKSVMLYKPS
jgi:hypothetical protein